MISYAQTVFDSWEDRPFSEVDSLILSWLTYLRFPTAFQDLTTERGMVLRDVYCAEYFEEMLQCIRPRTETISLLAAATASPRFRNIRLLCFEQEYDYDSTTQFAALTYELTPGQYYIAFRGTDCSLVGWKEDMLLALNDPIPSQKKASQYLQKITQKFQGTYMLGGHSKGGNLAVYAAAMCEEEIRRQITRVYSHDGPGFLPEQLVQDGFQRIRRRIHKTIPQSSLVGMIFESECDYHIVKSREHGLSQHNLFSWEVVDGHLLYQEDLRPEAKLAYTGINKWILNMAQEDREKFINVIFEILEETGVSNFEELASDLKKNVPIIVKKAASLDKETGRFLLDTIKLLVVDGVKSMQEIMLP